MLKRHLASRLTDSQRATINRWLSLARVGWLRLVRRSEWLCRFHALFVSGEFSLEARAVVSGQIDNIENRMSGERVNYFLRRGIHRLEKGLIMPDRRAVFGTDYIADLAEAYARAAASGGDPAELEWAHDVLSEYFAVVGDHPEIRRAHVTFRAAAAPGPCAEGPTKPYLQDRDGPVPVTPDAFHDLARRRRSVRFYDGRRVPRDLLDRAIGIAALSPSACNRQPFEFRIFDTIESAGKVSRLAGGTAGFSDQIPCLVVIVGRLRAYSYTRDRHAIYVDGGLAAMSLMYALETLGLASCPINWPDVRERELAMARTLNLRPDERVVMLISVGYPRADAMVAASRKLSLDVLRSYADPPDAGPRP